MAKKKKKKTILSKTESKKKQINFFSKHPNWSTVVILFVLLLIFYYQIVIEGKTLLPPDTLTAKSYQTFVNDALKQGKYPLWNPYIFSGMPSLGSLTAPLINIVDTVISYTLIGIGHIIPLSPFMRILINYLFLGLLTYLLLHSLNANRYACLFAAIAVIFLPQFVAFTAFGHNSKFLSVVVIPLIFWSVNQLLNKKNLLFFALTSLAIAFQLLRAHVQVCYYTYLFIGIYFIFYAVIEYKNSKKFGDIFKSAGLLAGAVVVALLLSSVLYISVYEYSHYSIRGGGTTGGLDYDYASSWSFAPVEMMTFLVPSFFGFGGATYWGKMPFTDYPLYMGIIVLFLAGLALVLRRDRYVIFLGIVAIFSLIVSFGKHLPILYDPMFKLLPFFNKFRVPSMIHILLDLSLVMMAGLGLHFLISLKKADDTKQIDQKYQAIKKYFYVFGGIGILIMLIVILGKGMFFNWIAESGKQLAPAVQQAAYQMAVKDSVIMVILLGICGFLVLYYLNKELKTSLLGIGVIFLVIIDLWLVDFKIIDPKPIANEKEFFRKTDVVAFLEKQDEPFRIFPIQLNQPGEKPDNWYMYFKLQNVYGYHAAKLKIYQEILEELQFPQMYMFKFFKQGTDAHGKQVVMLRSPEEIPKNLFYSHQAFLNMLNVKYLISAYPLPDTSCQLIKSGNPLIFENKHALPRAFFVDEIKILNTKDNIFDFIESGQFDPGRIAIIEEEPEFTIQPNPQNQVEVISYDIHKIKLKAVVQSPSLMVLSEIYYPAGWKAYVSGKETKIYKTNYILRSIFLKPGAHDIEFVFDSISFKLGLIISLVTLIFLVVAIVYSLRKNRRSLS